MELLPILYALLAAITGIHAGDRGIAAPASPVQSSISRSIAVEEARSIAVVRVFARPAVAAYPAVAHQRLTQRLIAIAPQTIFAIAHFAVRRE